MKVSVLSVVQANPVGQAHDVLEDQIGTIKAQWDAEKQAVISKWWQFWKTATGAMMVAVSFLLNCLDELIKHVNEFDISGPDKKATVLRACRIIYEYVVRECLPLVLKPVAGQIENIVINVVISYAIDWIVGKYQSGSWKGNDEQNKDQNTQSPEKSNTGQ